ncbi:MAG: MATE family efflux transporter [Dehalococcoidales bacterium]|nr:MATE family efflux transporter [Dehalococcoidales bacterium]
MNTQVALDKLDESHLPRTIFQLLWPVVIQEAAFGILAMVTTFLVGKFGATAITAVGLSENIVHLPEVVFAGISVGSTAIIARHVGAGEISQVNRTVQQALLLSIILGVIFAVIWWFLADWWLLVFRAKPEVVALGRDYIRINAPCIIFFFILYGGESLMRGSGDTRTPMLVTVTVEIIGTILAIVLIRGFWIVPALGVLGAGIARASVSFLGATIIMILLVRGRGILKWDLRNAFKFDFDTLKRILRVGLPAFLEQAQMRGAMSIYQIVISSLGTTVYAAHALAMRVEEFAFLPSWGFSIAATTMVGQCLGAKRPDLAEKSAKLAQRYCLIAMVSLGMITFFLGEKLIDIFIDDPEVIRLGALGLKIWAVAMPGMAINQTLAGGLRGAGDTRWVLLLSTIGMWTMRVGGGALLVYVFHLGAAGAWGGAVLDHTVRAVIIWWRFRTGKWKNIKV